MSNILKDAEAAIDQYAAGLHITTGPALKVEDLQTHAEKYLSDKALTALNRRTNYLELKTELPSGLIQVSHKTVYLGVSARISEVDAAVQKLAKICNALEDHMISALSHFIKVDLFVNDLSEPRCVIAVYPDVDLNTYNKIVNNPKTYLAFTEGAVPGDLNATN